MNFAQDVQSSLDTVNFIKLVRPLCVLTQGASSFINDDDIVFQGLQQFNNIGLVLSAAKDKDNTQLFKVPTTYQAVLNLILNSEYSSGLVNVAAELTAANIIRSLPIDGSLKLIERGNTLENRAYSNLDRIIFLYTTATANNSNSSLALTSDFFFFAPDIDKTTLLDSQFNAGLEIEPIKLNGVKVVQSLTVNPNEVAFVYFNVLKSEPGTPPLLNEGVTVVNNGQDIESFIYQLSSDVNTLCTNVYTTGTAVYPFSNLIAEPTRTQNIDASVSIKKSNFYKNTTTFLNKVANFSLRTFSVYLEFAARRLSTIVSREAITIRPLTIHKAALITPFTSFKGQYNISNLYNIGDVVIFNNDGYRALTNPPINTITDPVNWQLLNLSNITYTSNDLIIRKSTYIKNYIDGLLVGKQTSSFFNYQLLQQEGPLSAIVDVNKGSTSSASATTARSNAKIDHKIEIDTFYFSFVDPLNPFCTVAGNLLFRISTLSEGAPWRTIPIALGDKPEDVAFKLVQGILDYRIAEDTKVVGAQIYKDAVYINAYKITNPEVKVIVDVKFEEVQGITVASYYHLTSPSITSFSVAPRSVAVTTVLRMLGAGNTSNLAPPSVGASVVNLNSNKSNKMSRIQDKIGILNDVVGNQSVWNRSNMY